MLIKQNCLNMSASLLMLVKCKNPIGFTAKTKAVFARNSLNYFLLANKHSSQSEFGISIFFILIFFICVCVCLCVFEGSLLCFCRNTEKNIIVKYHYNLK